LPQIRERADAGTYANARVGIRNANHAGVVPSATITNARADATITDAAL